MTRVEFYEKYWKVVTKDGLVDVPKLSSEEKLVWDLSEELNVSPYVNYWKRKVGRVWEVHPLIKEKLNQLKQSS